MSMTGEKKNPTTDSRITINRKQDKYEEKHRQKYHSKTAENQKQ